MNIANQIMSKEKTGIILDRRMKVLRTFSYKVLDYVTTTSEIVKSLNIEDHKAALSNLDILNNASEVLPTKEYASFDDFLQLYRQLSEVDTAIVFLIAYLNNAAYVRLTIHAMSTSKAHSLQYNMNLAKTVYEKYIDISAEDDELILSKEVSDPIKAGSIAFIDAGFMFVIANIREVNKFMIRLITCLIVVTIGDRKRKLELIIESQKDLVIGADRINMSGYGGILGVLVRYNLRPASLFITEQAIRSLVTPSVYSSVRQGGSMEFDLSKIANETTGAILINRYTTSPMEFNIAGLIDIDYITRSNLITSPTMGLNDRIIQRFETVKMLQINDSEKPVKIYPVARMSQYFIVETLNNISYRLLSANGKVGPVSSNLIIGLLDGLSTRCHYYNTIHSNNILAKCADPRAANLLEEYELSIANPVSSEPLRNKLLDALAQSFAAGIAKNKPTDARSLQTVNKEIITTVVRDTIKRSVGLKGVGGAEYTITYLTRIDAITRGFTKELERKWSASTITDRMFLENTEKELHKILISVFRSTTQAAMDELDKTQLWTNFEMTVKAHFLEQKQGVIY